MKKAKKKKKKKWSQKVTKESDALDLEKDVFTKNDASEIARSPKASTEQSDRRKTNPFRSAMSMLVFYINRAGGILPTNRKKVLEDAKEELRKEFGKRR
ncbi:UNVERIFIED_ORG: type IV secretory pathway VirB10-like protein [Rhizobium sp. SLBN-170]